MQIIEKVTLKHVMEDVEIFRKDKYGNERYIGFIHGSDDIETNIDIEKIGNTFRISVIINGDLICSYHDVSSYKINLKEVK